MRKYESLFMVKPDMGESEAKKLFHSIDEAIKKNGGEISSSGVWSEKRKIYFPIKKCREAVYYLAEFSAEPASISKLNSQYRLKEDILRFLILAKEE